MKKTSYAIIAGIAALFVLGLCLTVYQAINARPLPPETEEAVKDEVIEQTNPTDSITIETTAE